MKDLVRRLIFEDGSRDSIYDKSGKLKSIGPKNLKEFGLVENGTTNIQQMLVLPFHSSILLRILNTWPLVKDAFRGIKLVKHKLWAIIGSNYFGCDVKLVMDHSNKVLDLGWYLRFWFHEDDPYKSGMVIQNCEEICMVMYEWCGYRPPNI